MISFFMYTSLRVVSDPLPGLRNLRLLGMGAVHTHKRKQMRQTLVNDVRDVDEAGCLREAMVFDNVPTPPSLAISSTTTSSPRTRSPTWSVYNSCRAEWLPLEPGLLLDREVDCTGWMEKALHGLDVWLNSGNRYVSVGPGTKEAIETPQSHHHGCSINWAVHRCASCS